MDIDKYPAQEHKERTSEKALVDAGVSVKPAWNVPEADITQHQSRNGE